MNQKPLNRPGAEKSSPESGVKENPFQAESQEAPANSAVLTRLVANPRISSTQKQALVQRYGAQYGNQQVQRLLKATQNLTVQRAPAKSPQQKQKNGLAKASQQKAQKDLPLLQISAGTFEDAARQLVAIFAEQNMKGKASILVLNSNRVRIYDEKGQLVTRKTFHFRAPVAIPTAVYAQYSGPAMHAITKDSKGKLGITEHPVSWNSGAKGGPAHINFSNLMDDYQGFLTALGEVNVLFLIVPSKLDENEQDKPRQIPEVLDEELPEFMRLGYSEKKANTNPFEADMTPLSPQIAPLNSVGSFLMEVHKDVGFGMVDRVTNAAQSISFHWQVLKLDVNDKVVASDDIAHVAGVKDAYKRRLRHAGEDYDNLLGDDRDKQGRVEKGARHAGAAVLTGARTAVGMVGETVLQFINTMPGGIDANYRDIMEVPWQQPGEYFVRCLATPHAKKDAPIRRATSVAGVRVSVYDIGAIAQEALPSAKQERETAKARLADAQEEYEMLTRLASGEIEEEFDPDEVPARLNELEIELPYLQEKEQAASDTLALKKARLKYLQNMLEYLKSSRATRKQKARLGQFQAELTRLQTELKRADSRLGLKPGTAKIMKGVYVNDTNGATEPLDFAISEDISEGSGRVKIRIVDITAEKGRICSGSGDSREEAWQNALHELRDNLGRGRGMLSYRPPAPYTDLKTDLPNPLRLQISALDQMYETAQDVTHIATLAALLAAIPSGGASLGALAVLAPVQAGLSLYRLVERSHYGTLELDAEAIADFINIASFGLANVGEAAPLASKGVQMLYSANKVAIRLLDLGNYVVMSYQTYKELSHTPEGLDPREASHYRLRALLSFFENAGIPISMHMYAKAGVRGRAKASQAGEGEGTGAGGGKPVTGGETDNVSGHQGKPDNLSHTTHEPTTVGDKANNTHPTEGATKSVVEEIQNNEGLRNQLIKHDAQAIKEVLARTRNWKELLGRLEKGSPAAQQVGKAILEYREKITKQLEQQFKLKIIGSKEWISDVDYIIEGENAGRDLVAAEKWMRDNVGEHWSEMLRANFYTEATRLIKYEEIQKHLTPEEKIAVDQRMTELTEVHNLARMLHHANKIKAGPAREAAIAQVKALAKQLGLKQAQMVEVDRLGSLNEAMILALRDQALPKIDDLVKRFNRTTNPKERVQLAVQITEMQIRGNFYTKEAYIGPGAGRQTVQGQKVSGHEAYQAALSHYEMFRHIVGEHSGDLGKAAREYELFKYVDRFIQAARGGGLSGPDLKFFETLGAYLYQVNRQAHAEGTHLQNHNAGEMRGKAQSKSTEERPLAFLNDAPTQEVTPEFLEKLSNDFVRIAEQKLSEMRRNLGDRSQLSKPHTPTKDEGG